MEKPNDTKDNFSGFVDNFSDKEPEWRPPVKKRSYFFESYWIFLLRIFAWFAFTSVVVTGIAGAVYVSKEIGVGWGLLIAASSVMLALLALAALMVWLNMARDVSRMAHDLHEIKQELRGK